mmetsp:Transcript_14768/g.21083  ORF Transcript_14768/g.21083 Transcript_14768/m.21083 type:complete len:211 (-) Transcript_14768:86-718(-)
MKKQQLLLILAIFNSCAMIASELAGTTAAGSSARKTSLPPSSSIKYKLDTSAPDDPSKKHWSRRALNSVLQCVDSEEDAETTATRSIFDIVARRFRSKSTKQEVVGVLTTTATKKDDPKTTSIQTKMDRLFRKPLIKETKDTAEQDVTTMLPPFVGRRMNRSPSEDGDFYTMNKKKLAENKIDAPVTFRRKHVLPSPKLIFHRIYIRFLC